MPAVTIVIATVSFSAQDYHAIIWMSRFFIVYIFKKFTFTSSFTAEYNKHMQKRLHIPSIGIALASFFVVIMHGLSPRPLMEYQTWKKILTAEEQGKYNNTFNLLGELIDLEPWRIDLWLQRGDLALRDGQPEITLEALKQIEGISSLSDHDQILLARAYEMNGDADSAQREWIELSKKTTLSDDAYLEIYTSLLRLEDLENAFHSLENWQAVNPSNPQVTYYLGINLVLKDQNEARKYLQLAVQNENLNSQKINDLLVILEMEGRESGYYWTLIGQSLGNLDEWHLAKAAIERVIKVDPSYADAWSLLGETKEQLGEDGYPELVTAQKLNPNSSFVKATLSLYWRREGHPEVALLYLHDLAQAEPNNSTWQIELAQTSVEMRDMISALSYFQSATNINPENASTWQKTAEFCLTYDIDLEGQGARAIDQAMKLAPDDAISQDLMGWKLLKSGDFDNAAKFFRKALSIDYNNARAHMHLGQALMNMDQKSEAQIELRKAIDISNDEGIKEMAQRLLEQLEN